MESLQETRRQIRVTLIVIALILITGVVGYMLIEGLSLLDSIWLTVITLATIGYGDIYARTDGGRIFTVLLIAFGIGTVAYGLQATASLLLSPAVREIRQRRSIDRTVRRLRDHYILCGVGELVDHTITYVLDASLQQRAAHRRQSSSPIGQLLRGWRRDTSRDWLLKHIVVVTTDHAFADHLRENQVLVLEGDPTSDTTLRRAGIDHARAMMVLIDSDSESLLTVLAARALNPTLDISVTIHDDHLAQRMPAVGANAVISPYEMAGQFLNLATLRPVVNEFFRAILFNLQTGQHTVALAAQQQPAWIGQTVGTIRANHAVTIIAIRDQHGRFQYVPSMHYTLHADDTLVMVVPEVHLPSLLGTLNALQRKDEHLLPMPPAPVPAGRRRYHPEEMDEAISQMGNHFVILCEDGETARHAISKLNPERPFVIVCDHASYAEELIERGFRVVTGDPQREENLIRAGVGRAQAVMVALDDDSDCVLSVLLCKTLNQRLRITATAHRDDLIPRLKRAGADQVIGPLQTAAQFLLLATIRPVVSDFLQHVVYNYSEGIETTELPISPQSTWLGQPLGALQLREQFQAAAVGIRVRDGSFIYAPKDDYTIVAGEVLIVITPMQYADDLRRLIG
jgi:voltage-gated potassium channel